MLPLRYARYWQLAGLTVLLLVLAAALMPALWFLRDAPDPGIFSLDKWLHGITFIFLTVWFSGQYRRRAYWRLAAGMLVFGVLIEVCQRIATTGRSAEIMDLVADSIGIALGLIVARAGAGGWSLRVEEWIQARQ
jgi:VanZ family protein